MEAVDSLYGKDFFKTTYSNDVSLQHLTETKKIKPYNMYRVSNCLDFLVSKANSCRTVWYNHDKTSKEQT